MLNIREEEKIKKLRDACRDLKVVPPPDIMIDLQVHDKDGNLTFNDIQRGHSWTRNFWNNIFVWIGSNATSAVFGAGYLSFRHYTGSLVFDAAVGRFNGRLANSNEGILVGKGSTAFSIEDYKLDDQAIEGTGTGQLNHALGTTVSTTYDEPTKIWTNIHSRIFTNNSGGTIIITETGIYFGSQCLVERSLLDPVVTMVDSARLTVNYSISMDFSAIDS